MLFVSAHLSLRGRSLLRISLKSGLSSGFSAQHSRIVSFTKSMQFSSWSSCGRRGGRESPPPATTRLKIWPPQSHNTFLGPTHNLRTTTFLHDICDSCLCWAETAAAEGSAPPVDLVKDEGEGVDVSFLGSLSVCRGAQVLRRAVQQLFRQLATPLHRAGVRPVLLPTLEFPQSEVCNSNQ